MPSLEMSVLCRYRTPRIELRLKKGADPSMPALSNRHVLALMMTNAMASDLVKRLRSCHPSMPWRSASRSPPIRRPQLPASHQACSDRRESHQPLIAAKAMGMAPKMIITRSPGMRSHSMRRERDALT